MELFTEHFKKDHFLLSIDARIKLLVAIILLVMVLSYKGFAFPLLVFSLGIASGIKMKIPLKVFILRFSEPLFIALVLILIKFLFSGKEAIWSLNFAGITLTGHKDGLIEGLLIASRIAGAVSIFALLGFATPFTEFIASLSWLKIPRGFIEILIFAYRYIFVLFEDATVIYIAQKNRLGYSSIKRGLSSFGTLTGSLTLKAFEQSQSITTAMVQRGYDGNIPMLKHKTFKFSEIFVSLLFVTFMGFIWKVW